MPKKISAPELLAPAGTWQALESAVEAGADAVYLGGRRFNMRLHRPDVNFDNAALAKAVDYTRRRGVKLYVAFNNLLSESELPAARAYLEYLRHIRPDAIIFQDLGLLELAGEMNLGIDLHASVMLNTHNAAAARALKDYGVTRVIACREMTLDQTAALKAAAKIAVEYFIHGDMCIAHSGQCLFSGIVFGHSANRGRCLKPCRWPCQAAGSAAVSDPGPYKLAMKDMCLYSHLPQLIQSGIDSLKIEGRMRTPHFIGNLVRSYRQAIDRYLADPAGYAPDIEDWRQMHESRVRDFSTCYAFGPSGREIVDPSGSREPRFFSQAVKETPPADFAKTAAPPLPDTPLTQGRPLLAVQAADLQAVETACQCGADLIYAGGEAYAPASPWTLDSLAAAREITCRHNAALVIATPRITMARECGELASFLPAAARLGPDAIMVGNIGALRLAKTLTTLPVHTDYSFNLLNSRAAAWLNRHGAVRAAVSLEAGREDLALLAAAGSLPLEIVVHGPLPAMITDYCLPRALAAPDVPAGQCRFICGRGGLTLTDSAGEKRHLRQDQFCRNHLFLANDLCLLPRLAGLAAAGIKHFRIEGRLYPGDYLGKLVTAYRAELDLIAREQTGLPPAALAEIAAAAPRPWGEGAFRRRATR